MCYDYSVRNALIGKKDCIFSFQRAAGWCKAVRSAVTLPLEQPAEQAYKVGPDGIPPVINGGHCRDAAEWVFYTKKSGTTEDFHLRLLLIAGDEGVFLSPV